MLNENGFHRNSKNFGLWNSKVPKYTNNSGTENKQLAIIDVPDEVLNYNKVKELEEEIKQLSKTLKIILRCCYYWDKGIYTIACNVLHKHKIKGDEINGIKTIFNKSRRKQ